MYTALHIQITYTNQGPQYEVSGYDVLGPVVTSKGFSNYSHHTNNLFSKSSTVYNPYLPFKVSHSFILLPSQV